VTYGGVGSSLVKGVVMQLPAIALSIKPGGSAQEIAIEGGLLFAAYGLPGWRPGAPPHRLET
jgi:hypothetical protein